MTAYRCVSYVHCSALLVYRVLRSVRKIYLKIAHAVLQAAALIISSVGLKAVFDSHNLAEPPTTNMYTLHSWIGMATVILFGIQVSIKSAPFFIYYSLFLHIVWAPKSEIDHY